MLYSVANSEVLLSSTMARGDPPFISTSTHTVTVMGILDTVGEIAGAVAAVEATEKVDPDAGLLTKGIAAVAGFKGAGALESLAEKKEDESSEQASDTDNAAPQA
jgi:uncharacterized protein (DUF362 family)